VKAKSSFSPPVGALTTKLLEKISNIEGSRLICIEKDHRLIDILNVKFKEYIESHKLIIHEGDVLDFDIEEYLKNLNISSYKLIANIPYYITGAIIEKFLNSKLKPSKIIIMVQKEVAERVIKKDGKNSILSLATEFYGTSKILKIVKPGSFNPPPSIDSAVLEINIYNDLETRYTEVGNREDFETFEKTYLGLVKKGLAHKRKILISNLKELGLSNELLVSLFQKLNIDLKIRGEDLEFAKWIELTKLITKK
jgi:16S rRNA (adenine1518-N6/adenine1519-N6)-dimethyltransferase